MQRCTHLLISAEHPTAVCLSPPSPLQHLEKVNGECRKAQAELADERKKGQAASAAADKVGRHEGQGCGTGWLPTSCGHLHACCAAGTLDLPAWPSLPRLQLKKRIAELEAAQEKVGGGVGASHACTYSTRPSAPPCRPPPWRRSV